MELNFNRCMDGEEQATTWCRPSSVEHHEDDDDDEGAIIAMAKAAISELKVTSKRACSAFLRLSSLDFLRTGKTDEEEPCSFYLFFRHFLFIY
jgi:hypothetical protein